MLQPDSSRFAGGEKPYRFSIHQLHFRQVKRHFCCVGFPIEELLQLRYISLLNSAAESEDRTSLIFGSANLEHRAYCCAIRWPYANH